MFKKPSSARRGKLSQYGLLDIPDLDDADEPLDLSDDDVDLEAELAAISGGSKQHRPRKPAPTSSSDLDAMIAASLRDIPSDDEASGDEDDSELLSELQELAIDDEAPPRTGIMRPAPPPPTDTDNSIISLLELRISNYTIAEKNAKDSGEISRARRFGRGLKTLSDLLKQAKAGKTIKNEDIPPPVSIPKPQDTEAQYPAPPPRSTSIPSNTPETPIAPEVPPRTPKSFDRPSPPEPKEPPPPPPQENQEDPVKEQGLQFILKRKEEFKAAALASKHAGDKALALEHLKVVKQFDIVVDAYKAGQEMDLNELPTPDAVAAAFKTQNLTRDETQTSAAVFPNNFDLGTRESVQIPEEKATHLELQVSMDCGNHHDPDDAPELEPAGLVTASSVDEALRQRLAHFQGEESKAKEAGNSSKARRMGRIVKQYQDAIKLHAAGKPISAEELPTPNGFAPLPTGGGTPALRSSDAAALPGPAAATTTQPGSPKPATSSTRRHVSSDQYEKQLASLRLRQKQFKDAAYKEKKNGNIEKARQFLRYAKGYDSVIQAAAGGLVVDLNSLPLPPEMSTKFEEATFDVVAAEDCIPADEVAITLDDDDVLGHMVQQLMSQLKICLTNRDHYRAMGNLAEGNRYENLGVRVKQDLDVVKLAKRVNQHPPKFRYETRQFLIVPCNTDLPDNQLELTIVRGIAYSVPNPAELDTYVKFEFAYPPEAPVSERTAVVKDTSSPQYDATFSLPIARSSRACLRFFKRHAVKCEVYSRGGWFSRDTLLGTVTVKLAPLETQVTIHEAFPLMDGRKAAGGTLEVRLRVRSPLGTAQLQRSVHRWLILDQ